MCQKTYFYTPGAKNYVWVFAAKSLTHLHMRMNVLPGCPADDLGSFVVGPDEELIKWLQNNSKRTTRVRPDDIKAHPWMDRNTLPPITRIELPFFWTPPPPSQVTEYLWLGTENDAVDESFLTRAGITHIIHACKICKCREDNDHRFASLRVPLTENPDTDRIGSHFGHVVSFIDNARSQGGVVLVHCRAGVSRSATLVAAYLGEREDMRYPHAVFDYLRDVRPVVNPDPAYADAVADFMFSRNTRKSSRVAFV